VGKGKTTIIKAIEAVMNLDYNMIRNLDASSIEIRFDNNDIIKVTNNMNGIKVCLNDKEITDEYLSNLMKLKVGFYKPTLVGKKCSAGEQNIFNLTKILSSNYDILLLDEPEVCLSVNKISPTLIYIIKENKSKQIIISTKSQLIIDEFKNNCSS